MKIGFLIFHRIDGRGGLENALLQIVNGLKKEGDESFLLFWEETLYPEFLALFDNVKIINPQGHIAIQHPFLPKFLNRKLQKKYDYKVMSNFFQKSVIPLNLDTLIVIDLPDTLVTFEPILSHYKSSYQVPILSWIHGSLIASTPKQIKRTQKLLPIFSRHLTVSQGIAKELNEIYQISNTESVNNPIDPADIIPKGNNNFIYIGRIGDPRKQVDRLIESLVNLQGQWSLDIIGSTGTEIGDQHFREKIELLGLQNNICVHGWMKDPWDAIKKADLLLLNSYTEGFGLVLAEAMMRGIPCVSSDCPTGPREIIQHGINGWLFDVGKEEQLIALLQKLINNNLSVPNPSLVQCSVLKYRSDIVIQNFKSILEEVITHS